MKDKYGKALFRFGADGRAESFDPMVLVGWSTLPVKPWRRFWSRTFDTVIFWGATAILALPLMPLLPMEERVGFFVLATFFGTAWIVMPVVNGLVCGISGFTPGKLLFGLRIVDRNGQPIGIARSISREYRALFEGLGLQLFWPIIPLQRLAISTKEIERTQTTRWDRYVNVCLYRDRQVPVSAGS